MEDIIRKKPGPKPKVRVIDTPSAPTMDNDWRGPIEAADTLRGDVRGDLRESDPQEAARIRAQQILNQHVDMLEESDEFFVPEDLKDPHWDVQWVRHSCYNQEDVNNVNRFKRHGWTEIPANRPGYGRYVPKGWKENFILKDGMLLMERPKEVSRLMQERADQEVAKQMRIAEQRPTNPNIAFPTDNAGRPISMNGVAGVRKTIQGPIPN